MTIYAQPGSSEQTVEINPAATVPDNCVRMLFLRPDGDGWVAGDNGIWINKRQNLTPDELAEVLLQTINGLLRAKLNTLADGRPFAELEIGPNIEREASLWQRWHDRCETGAEPATPLIDAILKTRNSVNHKRSLVRRILHYSRNSLNGYFQVYGIRKILVNKIQAVLDDPRLTDDQKIQRLEEIDITSPFATLLDQDAVSP